MTEQRRKVYVIRKVKFEQSSKLLGDKYTEFYLLREALIDKSLFSPFSGSMALPMIVSMAVIPPMKP